MKQQLSVLATLAKDVSGYWTSWASYLLIILGGLMTYWDSLSNFVPEKFRGPSYALIGLIVLLLRGRGDIVTAAKQIKAINEGDKMPDDPAPS